MLKLGIHMDNKLLNCGIENWTPCSYSFFYLSIFLSFKAKFVSQFSPELYMVESSNMVYICRMSDCIVGLRLRVMALILLFLSIFPSFPQFSPELCKLESSKMVYICRMSDCILGLRLRVMAFIYFFFSISLSVPIVHVNIKKFYVGVFSGAFKARMLKLGIHMDNKLLNCGIENWTPCSYSSFYLSMFLSFKAKFVSQFSPDLCKLESSKMVYICRMSDCIVGLRLRVMAHIFLFFHSFFFLSIYNILTLKICVRVFSVIFKARM